MTASTISAGNLTTRFQSEVRKEYVRKGRFGPFIGNDQNSVIQTNKDLKKTSIALVAKLKGAGVKGSALLNGSEEALSNFDFTTQPTYFRNGVLIDQEERELSEFDLFSEARPSLMNWTMERKRDQIIQELNSIQAGGVNLFYGGSEGSFGATAAAVGNYDTWNTNNQDRVLYGEAIANNTSGNHTASLAAITVATGKLTSDSLTLAKRLAERANPLIRPISIDNDEPVYVYFVDPFGFRDLKEDATIVAANREARPRDVAKNPIFTGGDLFYDGIIIKKIPEIANFIDGDGTGSPWDAAWGSNSNDSLAIGGDTASRVGVGFMCGAQAIAFGLGRLASFKRRKEDDYDHLAGVGITMKHDIKKIFYNDKQHGILTHYFSASLDV